MREEDEFFSSSSSSSVGGIRRRRRVKGGGVCMSTSFVHYLQQVVAFEGERKEVFSRQSKFFLFFFCSFICVCLLFYKRGGQSVRRGKGRT